MPGKHYKGMPKYKSDKQRMAVHASKAEKKGMPKLSEKQAKHIDTNKDGKISGADFPINRGIGNYKGSGNFAMKNKMLSDSAKNGIPMQKNYNGMPNKPGSTQEKTKNKKSTDTVVNPDTNVVTDVATQRLIEAGAPKGVIEEAKAKFIKRETSKK